MVSDPVAKYFASKEDVLLTVCMFIIHCSILVLLSNSMKIFVILLSVF